VDDSNQREDTVYYDITIQSLWSRRGYTNFTIMIWLADFEPSAPSCVSQLCDDVKV